MTKRIVIAPKASQDLDQHFAYIAQNNLDIAPLATATQPPLPDWGTSICYGSLCRE